MRSPRDVAWGVNSFLFDEGIFILDKLKNRRFIDVLIKKFASSATCAQLFMINYLHDIPSCPTRNLEVVMEIAAKHEHILVGILVKSLRNNKLILDENTRYILERLNYKTYPSTHESAYQRLFKSLEEIENPSGADFKLIMKALQQYNRVLKKRTDSMSHAALPNLFHGFNQLSDKEDLDSLINFLIESSLVRNSYIFYDAICSWTYDKEIGDKAPCVSISNNFVKQYSDLALKKGWKPLDLKYIERKNYSWLGGLTGKMRASSSLVTDNCLNRIPASSEYTAEEFFSTNHSIKFKYKQDFITKCRQKGDCGFILQVTASTGKQDDSFNIQLVIDPSLYPADIHFHQESLKLVDNLHLALDLVAHNDQVFRDRSVTWYGKPCRDGTGRYWCWGAHYFYRSGKGTAPPGEVLRRVTASGASTRIRPVVYLLG